MVLTGHAFHGRHIYMYMQVHFTNKTTLDMPPHIRLWVSSRVIWGMKRVIYCYLPEYSYDGRRSFLVAAKEDPEAIQQQSNVNINE